MLLRRFVLALLFIAGYSVNASAGLITYTGSDLLSQPGVVQPNANWSVSGNSISHSLNNGGNLVLLRWDNIFAANLFTGGSSLTVTLNMTSLSSDQDPMIALADGSTLIGAGIFDTVNPFTGHGTHNGSTFTYSLQIGSNSASTLTTFELQGVFSIAANGTTGVTSNVSQGAENNTLTENDSVLFNLAQPLSLLFLGQSSAESYQINSITLEGDAINNNGQIPVPGTMALFGLGLAGLGFARRKAA